ncbi:hypothetical protein BN1708_018935, partial [Verticillium longisporum]
APPAYCRATCWIPFCQCLTRYRHQGRGHALPRLLQPQELPLPRQAARSAPQLEARGEVS